AHGGSRTTAVAPLTGRMPATPEALVTVVVPARDEGAVIGRLVADLAAARSDPMALIVVDDASCDGLADLARAAFERGGLADVAHVVRLATPSGSKGAALAAAAAPTAGVIVVLDADARVGPDFVARCRLAGTTGSAAQARRRMLRPVTGWRPEWAAAFLALVQDGEQELDGLVARARLRVGGAAEFRGDGMVIRADALASLGGWAPDALCEDLELATRWYLATGRGVERPAGLEIWEQPVLRVRHLLGQRLRWAEGSIRRDIRLVLPALLDSRQPVRRRVELGAYGAQALMPWVGLGLALAALGSRNAAGRQRGDRPEAQRAARDTLATLASGYALAALVLAWGSQADDADGGERLAAVPGTAASRPATPGSAARPPATRGAPDKRRAEPGRQLARLGRAIAVSAFSALWTLVLPVAWLRVAARPGAPQFVRTPHATPARFSEPGSGPPPPT
ncbi:MAG TPA: glycosyltransferase family 2 protein, partial [Candidatus Limnocylindrales bacterium]